MFAVSLPVGVSSDVDGGRVVQETVEEGDCEDGVWEDLVPLAVAFVACMKRPSLSTESVAPSRLSAYRCRFRRIQLGLPCRLACIRTRGATNCSGLVLYRVRFEGGRCHLVIGLVVS